MNLQEKDISTPDIKTLHNDCADFIKSTADLVKDAASSFKSKISPEQYAEYESFLEDYERDNGASYNNIFAANSSPDEDRAHMIDNIRAVNAIAPFIRKAITSRRTAAHLLRRLGRTTSKRRLGKAARTLARRYKGLSADNLENLCLYGINDLENLTFGEEIEEDIGFSHKDKERDEDDDDKDDEEENLRFSGFTLSGGI